MPTTHTIRIADGDDEVSRCYPVMRNLRPHVPEGEFLGRVRRQQGGGYVLAYLEDSGNVTCVAGFRVVENLMSGRMLYVDDLVTLDGVRSRGYGKQMFDWLVARARSEGCAYLELDSGVHRFDAHRFYATNRMMISAHHFALKL